jgi:DNA-binding response OmpR family regulator
MKTLIIDRDEMNAQMMTSRLEQHSHNVIYEPVKNEGVEKIANEQFDLVFIDPSPMKDAQALTLNIKRRSRYPLYLVLLAGDDTKPKYEEVTKAGCNDFLMKPVDAEQLETKVANAKRLHDLAANLGDTREDFPSAGGVISKSAFNQLFLSAMDRSGRYNELTYILAIAIDNYNELKEMDGAYSAEYSASKMAYHVVRLRRMSDIIGQTGKNEYQLLLQRTVDETEAIEAAKRFAASLDEFDDIVPPEGNRVTISVNLIHLPSGALCFSHKLKKYPDIPGA